MNLLSWPREHQLALLVTCILGGLIGMFLAFVTFMLQERATAHGALFFVWFGNADLWWSWPIFCGAIAGLGAYAIRLWKISN
jgi:hypothetical protein